VRVVLWRKHSSANLKNPPANRIFRRGVCCTRSGPVCLWAARGTRSLGALLLAVATLGAAAFGGQSTSGAPGGASAASGQSATSGAAAATTAGKIAGGKIAAVKSFRIIQEADGPAVEILSTRPLAPEIHLLKEPTRLVIDLPNARLDAAQKRIEVGADQISALRANQFQDKPPVARVVVDMLAARAYTLETMGNRLVVHLGKNPEGASPFEAAAVPSVTRGPKPVIKAVRAAGPLVLANHAASAGAAFTAGADTAVLSLSSGGELRVCPGTTVSIAPSANRHNLLLGMNAGAIETHLDLDASTDLVMTPDFRIALEGPGQFHFAFSTDNRGDTCVRALPGNTASVTATELLGDRTYLIGATDQLVFRGGRLEKADMNVPLECGCPPPRQNMGLAANEAPADAALANEARPAASSAAMAGDPPASAAASGVAAVETTQNQVHVQITAPLVFHASGPPPAPVEDVRAMPVEAAPARSAAPPPVIAAATGRGLTVELEPQRQGFFRRIGGWFARIFGRG